MYPNRPHGCVESYIIHLLEINTRISVEELCQTFNLAPSTIQEKARQAGGAGPSDPHPWRRSEYCSNRVSR